MSKNFSMYGLPENVVFCSKCVMSNQRPKSVVEFKNSSNQKFGLNIDTNSRICDACNYNNTKEKIDWKNREDELLKLYGDNKELVFDYSQLERKITIPNRNKAISLNEFRRYVDEKKFIIY